MEIILNLVWALLALLFMGLWLRHAPRNGASTRMQAVALLMTIVIFFPVISVTDDLQMALNPAEADAYYLCTRRDHAAVSPHSILPAVATLPPPVFAELSFGFLGFAAPSQLPTPLVKIPAMASIQNRPPPAA
jgi:hypothetical protein